MYVCVYIFASVCMCETSLPLQACLFSVDEGDVHVIF